MTADDDPIMTAQEERAAAALRRALTETNEEWPVHVATSVWVARTPQRRSTWIRLPLAAAAALSLVLVGVVALATWPRTATAPLAAPTSRPGHFDNGQFSFDYPATWRTLSGPLSEPATSVAVVLGTGDWQTGCHPWSSGGFHGEECTGDKVDVSGGRIVVKVYRFGGPAPSCGAGPTPNAELGPNSVIATTTGSATTWELREPSAQFGSANNIFVEAYTDSAVGLASAEALVASLRWAPGVKSDVCPKVDASAPSPKLAHYNADGISFDYPATWPVISGHQHWGLHGPTIEFAVGTGTADAGCTLMPPSSTVLDGVACGIPTIAATGDQIVVVWYEGPGLGVAPLPARSLAPDETRVTIGGMPAIESHGDGWVKWQLSAVGYIEARWGPGAVDAESAVDAVIASLSIEAPQTKPS
jgi:hypothetical protein